MLALRVQEVKEERRENLDLLVLLAPLVQKVHQEMMVLKEVLVRVVSPVILVLLESLGLLDWMGLLVTREMTERLVSLDPLDQLVKLAPPVLQEREDLMDLLDLKEDRERRVPRANPVWRVLLVRRVRLDLREPLESLVLRV